jgi:hypothetical protein
MLGKTYKCVVVLACGIQAVLLAGLSASADEKKDDKEKAAPSGAWVRKEGELKIEFDDKGALKIAPHGDSDKIAIVCDTTVEKDGRIKVKVTGIEGSQEKAVEKIKEKIAVGLEFNFKWTAKDDKARLDDLKGEGDVVEHLKSHLEGDYEQKK